MSRTHPSKLPEDAFTGNIFDDSAEEEIRGPSGVESFIRSFSSFRDHRQLGGNFGRINIGLLANLKNEDETRRHLAASDEAQAHFVRELLADQTLSQYAALMLLWRAVDRYEDSHNPLWLWLLFDASIQTGIPPSSFVWRYFARAAFAITDGATSPRPLTRQAGTAARAPFRMNNLMDGLELRRRKGSPDYFDQFRLEISEYRVAVRVWDARPAKYARSATGVMQICRRVAREYRKETGQKFGDSKTETMRVYKAYQRWFGRNSGMAAT